MEPWEGAIRLPKASRWPTCKPLETIAKHHFTSKRPSPLEGCEADCNLAPKRGNESALPTPSGKTQADSVLLYPARVWTAQFSSQPRAPEESGTRYRSSRRSGDTGELRHRLVRPRPSKPSAVRQAAVVATTLDSPYFSRGLRRYHPCFIARANFCVGSVFSTSSLVSQARRAWVTP